MPITQLPAVVTIFDLATTTSIPLTALIEVQFTTGGLGTTVGVPFSQIATSIASTIASTLTYPPFSVVGVAGSATTFVAPITASATGSVLQFFGSALAFGPLAAGVQRSVLGSATIATTDGILNFTLSTAATQSVPLASTRNGIPLVFQDAALNFSTNNLTLNRSGSDTFSGATTILMATDGQRLTLFPFNDGTNAGYSVA